MTYAQVIYLIVCPRAVLQLICNIALWQDESSSSQKSLELKTPLYIYREPY